ncbi:hypothetical protein G8B50_06725 [Enterococcus durans]|uniref:hypothetical protein n=1 Tax=Enterococcus durans TaxID=53345 RepID=UPI0018833592|nr:hypothetical protein [Enterococcus durans]MBE9887368.1 hypothetical protein [Enterococcus durans]
MKKYLLLLSGALLFLSSCTFHTTNQKNASTYDYFLYFSTTMDKYLTSGRLIGVGDKNQVLLKTSGLELGSFTQLNHQIYTSDRQYDYIYTPETNEVMKTKRATKEHTGISTMVIEETVVKIFNHGYSDDGSYGNHFYVDDKHVSRNKFIIGLGHDSQQIYTLHEDTEAILLYQHTLVEGDLTTQFASSFPHDEHHEYIFVYDLVVHKDGLYGIAFNSAKDYQSKLFHYSMEEKQCTFTDLSPDITIDNSGFPYSNGGFIYNDQLVYLASDSTIYFIDFETGKISKQHRITIDLTGVFFVDPIDEQNIAIASYDQENNIDIWTLNLTTFNEKKERTVHSTLWRNNEHLYDFQVKK